MDVDDDPNNAVTWRCVNCAENACLQCCNVYQRFRATKSHQVIEIGKTESEHLLSCNLASVISTPMNQSNFTVTIVKR